MTPDRLRDSIAAALDAEIEVQNRIVLSGSCQTLDEYRHHAGQIRGFQRARAVVDKAYRDMFEDRKIEDKKL